MDFSLEREKYSWIHRNQDPDYIYEVSAMLLPLFPRLKKDFAQVLQRRMELQEEVVNPEGRRNVIEKKLNGFLKQNIFKTPKRHFMDDLKLYFFFSDALKDMTNPLDFPRENLIDWLKVVLRFLSALSDPSVHIPGRLTRDKTIAEEIQAMLKSCAFVSYSYIWLIRLRPGACFTLDKMEGDLLKRFQSRHRPLRSFMMQEHCFNSNCFLNKDAKSKCSRCIFARYCCAECQKADWSLHKTECSRWTGKSRNDIIKECYLQPFWGGESEYDKLIAELDAEWQSARHTAS
jgi:hypothetical protein